MKRKSILRIIVFLAVFIIACTVALPFAVTPLINTEQVKARLTRVLQERTGIEIRFNHLAFTLKPLPGINITDISAKIDQGTHVTIKSALVELDPAQLMEFKANVNRITLQSPELIRNTAVTDQNDPTTIPPLDIPASLQNVFNRLLALVPADPGHLDINLTGARSTYFNTMDCRILLSGRARSVNINAQISGLRIDTHRIPKLESALNGRITGFDIPHLSLCCRHDDNAFFQGNLNITSLRAHLEAPKVRCIEAKGLNLEFALSKDKVTANLSPLELLYPKGILGMELSLSLGQETSRLKFTGEQIDISQTRQVCLPLLNGLKTSQTLFDILRAGTARNITVGFKSNTIHHLFNTQNLSLNGCAESATVKIPSVPVIVKNTSGCAWIKEGVLSIHPKAGQVGNTLITGGDLDINLIHEHIVPFSGKFPLKIDFSQLPPALIAIFPDTVLARELSKLSGLTGQADAVLELDQTKTTKKLDVRVSAENIQAKGNYQRLPLPIQINEGTFLLDKGKIILKNMSGAVGGSGISHLNADIDTNGSVSMSIKNTAANINLGQAVPLINLFPGAKEKLGPVKNFSGIMDIKNLTFEGPMFSPNLWQVSMTGRVNNGAVGFYGNTQGISGLSCKFNTTPVSIKVAELVCTIKGATWLEKNISPEYVKSIAMPLVLTQGRIEKQKGAGLFQGQLLTPSGAKVFFTADGPDMDNIVPSKVQLVDGEITRAYVVFYKNPNMPKLNFSGKLDKTTLENMLVPDSYLYRKLQKITGENKLTVSTDKAGNITISCKKLNLNPLLSLQKASARTAPSRPLVKQKQIFLNTDTVSYGRRVYQGVQTKITTNRLSTEIDVIHALLCGLDLSGKITVNHAGNSPGALTHLVFNTEQAEEVSLSIGCLTDSQSVIEGSYTLKAQLTGSAQTLDLVTSKQNGHISFKAQSGRIYKATLLSRLLSVLNILGDTDLQQQGFGFKTFTADADVKDSVVHIKNAVIDADNMAIMAQGWADPLNDTLDITILVAPFKTIDTIIKNIPIINTVFNDRLVSFPTRAYGKLSDPTVVLLHPSAVGKGLLNLLERLAKTPGRLIERVDKNEKNP